MTTAPYMPSSVANQRGMDAWSLHASASQKPVEITRPNHLAMRMRLNAATTAVLYTMTTSGSANFHEYYYTQLHKYLEILEQKVTERRGKHSKCPVSLTKLGAMLALVGSLADCPAPWKDGVTCDTVPVQGPITAPDAENYFTYIGEVKQFCGEWKLNGGYSHSSASQDGSTPENEATSYESPNNETTNAEAASPADAQQWSVTFNFDDPCNLTFYQFKTDNKDEVDKAIQQIVDNWPGQLRGKKKSCLGIARIEDVLCVTTASDETKILDAVVMEVLAPYLKPVIVESCPYPGRD